MAAKHLCDISRKWPDPSRCSGGAGLSVYSICSEAGGGWKEHLPALKGILWIAPYLNSHLPRWWCCKSFVTASCQWGTWGSQRVREVTLNKNQSQSNTFSTKKGMAVISADTDTSPDNRQAVFMSKLPFVIERINNHDTRHKQACSLKISRHLFFKWWNVERPADEADQNYSGHLVLPPRRWSYQENTKTPWTFILTNVWFNYVVRRLYTCLYMFVCVRPMSKMVELGDFWEDTANWFD